MIVYSATRREFTADVLANQIELRIQDAFESRTGRSVSHSEVTAWKNSLLYMNNVLLTSEVDDDASVAIEYTIPQSAKRIDFILAGQDERGADNAVIVELKQWTTVTATDRDGIVETFLGGTEREVPHPSYQAWSYAALIRDYNEAVQQDNIRLRPCAYLHNCTSPETIRSSFYKYHTDQAPAFLKADAEQLASFIRRFVRHSDANKILYRIEHGKIRPSKDLADHLVSLLHGKREFILIDDQKVVYERALALSESARDGSKQVLVVEGGPGTGKSVVAINLLVELTRRQLVAQYVTRNAAPRTVYQAKLAGSFQKTRISNLFKGSGAYIDCEPDVFDALIVDEAHRLNRRSGMYRKGENQIKEIIRAAKFSAFFIDEDQRVTFRDIGETAEILRWARELGAEVRKLELSSQFRCNGSDGYLAWVDNTLQIRNTANATLESVDYDFRVFDDPNAMFRAIENKNRSSNKARVVAGYCWDWKGKKDPTIKDVVIPEHGFAKRWNLGSDGMLWILKPESVQEIGCIHTCQGLELEYIGVIIGRDLVVRSGHVVVDAANRSSQDQSIGGYRKLLKEDPERARALAARVVKNTYRALMTRGQKGCFLYCVDPETNAYFKTMTGSAVLRASSVDRYPGLSLRILLPEDVRPYENAVPLIDLEMAAGHDFSVEQVEQVDDSQPWVELPDSFRPRPGQFVTRVVGESMNRRIPNGSWCLFRANPAGSRQGKIVIVAHREFQDAETGTRCTIKVYTSEKSASGDSWEHERIILRPASFLPGYQPIELSPAQASELRVVGELVAILS